MGKKPNLIPVIQDPKDLYLLFFFYTKLLLTVFISSFTLVQIRQSRKKYLMLIYLHNIRTSYILYFFYKKEMRVLESFLFLNNFPQFFFFIQNKYFLNKQIQLIMAHGLSKENKAFLFLLFNQ